MSAFWAARQASDWGKDCAERLRRLRELYQIEAFDGSWEGIPHAITEIAPELVATPLSENAVKLLMRFQPVRLETFGSDQWRRPAPGSISIQLFPDEFTVKQVLYGVTNWWERDASTVIHGLLEWHFETGSEGTIWCIVEDAVPGYDGLHPIRQGDHLSIMNSTGGPVWSGKIDCDWETGYRPYPLNPKYGQPAALGLWIHWTQRGFKPDDWARYFVGHHLSPLRGVLRRVTKP